MESRTIDPNYSVSPRQSEAASVQATRRGGLNEGSPAAGDGVLRRDIIVVPGDADGLVRHPRALAAPPGVITDPAGVTHLADAPKCVAGKQRMLRDFQAALVLGDELGAQAIVEDWQGLSLASRQSVVNERIEGGRTALHLASRFSQGAGIVRALIALGADVHACAGDGAQALHIACGSDRTLHTALCKMLADPLFASLYARQMHLRPNDPLPQDARRAIVEYRARARGRARLDPEKVTALLHAGASPRARQAFNCQTAPFARTLRPPAPVDMTMSAWEMAILNGWSDIADLMARGDAGLRADRSLREVRNSLAKLARDLPHRWGTSQPTETSFQGSSMATEYGDVPRLFCLREEDIERAEARERAMLPSMVAHLDYARARGFNAWMMQDGAVVVQAVAPASAKLSAPFVWAKSVIFGGERVLTHSFGAEHNPPNNSMDGARLELLLDILKQVAEALVSATSDNLTAHTATRKVEEALIGAGSLACSFLDHDGGSSDYVTMLRTIKSEGPA